MFQALRWLLRKRSPEAIEAQRRAAVHRDGRLIAGMVVDILEDGGIVYQYDVGGVDYTATQDVSLLPAGLPEERWRLLGPVRVKYAIGNPANSIILCEDWSGVSSVEGAQPQK